MENFDFDLIKDKIHSLSVSTPVDTNFFDTEIFEPEEIARKCALLEVYRYLFALDSLGIPLNFLMNLPDIYARLLIMLADGKFLPEIINRLDLNVNDLLMMAHNLLKYLEKHSDELKREEIGNMSLFIKDFIITEIQMDNI